MHAHFAGIILSSLLYPFSVGLVTLQYFWGGAFDMSGGWLEHLLLSAALFSLLAGHAVALLHAAASAIGRKRWDLLLLLPTMPLYWFLISLAAYRALYQLATQPFLWEKTQHGVSNRKPTRPAKRALPRRRRRVLHS